MRTLFIITFLAVATISYGQKKVTPPPPPKMATIYFHPEFPGGEPALKAFFAHNLHYPPAAIEAGVSGRVGVQFFVNEHGKISDVKVLRGIGAGCDDEALRLVKSMPDWKPGSYNGKPVGGLYQLPVTFKLE